MPIKVGVNSDIFQTDVHEIWRQLPSSREWNSEVSTFLRNIRLHRPRTDKKQANSYLATRIQTKVLPMDIHNYA